ncbi:MAG TPA: SDR family oxidoreductase, partial [Acidimicrobiia bacterium]
MRLADKSIVITGATGIAAAALRRTTAEGARVFVVSIGETETRAISDIPGVVGVATADLSDEQQAVEAIGLAHAVLGGMDGLLAVAGGSGRRHGDGPADTVSLTAWEATLGDNAAPMFLSAREAFRHMAGRGGSVVIVSSVLATSPSPTLFATHAYAAAKGAADAFTRASAAYYAPKGIRVNAIAPGLVDTP